MKQLHFWQKRPRRREARPSDRSWFRHWIELPWVRFLFRWRRRLRIRLDGDPMFQRKGPFVITWHAQAEREPGHGYMHTYMDWERTQSEKFQLAARELSESAARARRMKAAKAMAEAGHRRARLYRELPLHMDT